MHTTYEPCVCFLSAEPTSSHATNPLCRPILRARKTHSSSSSYARLTRTHPLPLLCTELHSPSLSLYPCPVEASHAEPSRVSPLRLKPQTRHLPLLRCSQPIPRATHSCLTIAPPTPSVVTNSRMEEHTSHDSSLNFEPRPAAPLQLTDANHPIYIFPVRLSHRSYTQAEFLL